MSTFWCSISRVRSLNSCEFSRDERHEDYGDLQQTRCGSVAFTIICYAETKTSIERCCICSKIRSALVWSRNGRSIPGAVRSSGPGSTPSFSPSDRRTFCGTKFSGPHRRPRIHDRWWGGDEPRPYGRCLGLCPVVAASDAAKRWAMNPWGRVHALTTRAGEICGLEKNGAAGWQPLETPEGARKTESRTRT